MKNSASLLTRPYAPFAAAAAFAVCLGLASANKAEAQGAPRTPFTVVEAGKSFESLQEAVSFIGNRKASIAIANGVYHECAVQVAGDVSYYAVQPGGAIFEGEACEDKAAFVLRGNSANVAGIVFRGIEVDDYNGSGIRVERGNLTVTQSWFVDSQQGVMSAEDTKGLIVIDKSTFSGLGNCESDDGCAHSIYIGNYGHLRITRSRFERGTGGHYVKSRAARVEIASSSFDDALGNDTNYMIDLPSGGTGQISNNWFVMGPKKDNSSTIIAVGAEPDLRYHSSDGLLIEGNEARLAPGADYSTAFVVIWNQDKIKIGPNNLGKGIAVREQR